MSIDIVIVVGALIAASLLLVLWKKRIQVIGLLILAGIAYLFLNTRVYMVTYTPIPMMCIVGAAALAVIGLFMLPRLAHSNDRSDNKQQVYNHIDEQELSAAERQIAKRKRQLAVQRPVNRRKRM